MPLALTQYAGRLGTYIRANRGGALKNPDQGESQPGIQRLGIVKSNAGVTYYLYYDPAADIIAYDTTAPSDVGATG